MNVKLRLKKLNQHGMVSIIVTMVLIIVMTLVVLAMSRNSIREQRQSLDRQLSDQAFYNAETGINDWVNYLYTTPGLPADKLTCDTPPAYGTSSPPLPSPDIGTSGVNKYTCLMYNKRPPSIIFNDLVIEDAKTIPLKSATGIKDIIIEWSSPNGNNNISGCPDGGVIVMPRSLGNFCTIGGLEINLVDPGALSRQALIDNNFIAYLMPRKIGVAGPGITYSSGKGSANQGIVGVPTCTDGASGSCILTIRQVNSAVNFTQILHIKSLYLANKVVIRGTDFKGLPVNFEGAQIMLDATGKANDVLRRVQVRVGVSQLAQTDFALRTADSICKLISVNKDAGTATIDTSRPGCSP